MLFLARSHLHRIWHLRLNNSAASLDCKQCSPFLLHHFQMSNCFFLCYAMQWLFWYEQQWIRLAIRRTEKYGELKKDDVWSVVFRFCLLFHSHRVHWTESVTSSTFESEQSFHWTMNRSNYRIKIAIFDHEQEAILAKMHDVERMQSFW